MKVVILVDEFGMRMAGAKSPNPIVKIGNKLILYHVMNYYNKKNKGSFLFFYKKLKFGFPIKAKYISEKEPNPKIIL